MQELPGLKRIAGLALEYMGVDELEQTITVCGACYDSLLNNKRPEFAVANGFLFGPVPDCLRDLTFVEWRCIQRNRVSVIVEQLHDFNYSVHRFQVAKCESGDVMECAAHGTQSREQR